MASQDEAVERFMARQPAFLPAPFTPCFKLACTCVHCLVLQAGRVLQDKFEKFTHFHLPETT